MPSLLRLCLLLALPFLGLPSVRAAYTPAVVSADARWVIYADLNSLRAGTVGKELMLAMEKAQSQATGGVIGIDIPKLLATIGTLTAYGTNLSSDPSAIDGTLIIQGAAEMRTIAESLLLQGTLAQPKVFSEVSDLPFSAYAIADPNATTAEKARVVIAFPPEPIVIVSKSKPQVVKARDVFRGTSPSLANTPASPLNKFAATAEGAFLYTASVVPTEPLFPQNAPQTRILQLASSGSLALGERGPNTFAHAELLASSEQNAERLTKILQGMTAMLSLAETNDKQLAEFINSTSVTRRNDTVTLDLAYASSRLAQMVQGLRSTPEPRPANRAPSITNGKALAEWTAPAADGNAATDPNALSWRTIENVSLVNGTTITLGRALNGGRNARFDRVEISAAEGTGSPLVFRSEFMRAVNNRSGLSQFQFPGSDGVYIVKIAYVNDPDGKAKFAVSVRDPKLPAPGKK